MQDSHNMVHLLQQKHKLEVGSLYFYRPKGFKGDVAARLWEFVSLDGNGAKFKHAPLIGVPETMDLEHDDLKRLKLFEKKPPVALTEADQAKLDPLTSQQMKNEVSSAEATCRICLQTGLDGCSCPCAHI